MQETQAYCTSSQGRTTVDVETLDEAYMWVLDICFDRSKIDKQKACLANTKAKHKAEVRIQFNNQVVEMTFDEFLAKIGLKEINED